MAYNSTLYINTGFNSVNIPYSPSILETMERLALPSLEIVQDGGALTYIDVKVLGFSQVENVDYAKVGNYYYFVDGSEIKMISGDTARIPLYLDYLTSLGGVEAIVSGSVTVLDGITNRVHTGSDNFGEWDEPDPYMAPAHPLDLVTKFYQGSGNYVCVVKSTLNLSAMGTASGKIGLTYTDSTTGETVTVPATIANNGTDDTEYTINTIPTQTAVMGESKTKLFDVDNSAIRKALQEVNDLGINGAISAQVAFPEPWVIPTITSGGVVTKVVGKDVNVAITELPYIFAPNVKNNKINYSSYCSYGIATASGDKKDFLPKDIYVNGSTEPILRIISDPRTDGKPYFRFNSLNGDTSLAGFFRNAVEGMPWKQIPLVYEGNTGIALAQLSHNQTAQQNAFNMSQTQSDIKQAFDVYDIQNLFSTIGGFLKDLPESMAAGAVTGGGPAGAIGGAIGNAIKWGASYTGKRYVSADVANYALDRNAKKYEFDKGMEQQKYLSRTMAYNPTVQLPFSANLYNDLYNNPCVVYRYKYNNDDIARIDKILTMYGYKVTKALESGDFNRRQYFNYVEAKVSLGGTKPRWMLEGAGVQISNGVRVWKVKPSPSYYANNPINA